MEEYGGRMAVLGITNEMLGDPGNGWGQVVFIKGNMQYHWLPPIHKVPVDELNAAKHGDRFKSKPAKLSLSFPYPEDHIHHAKVNGHIVNVYRIAYCNGIPFACKEKQAYEQLVSDVISLAQCRLMLPEREKVLRFVRTMFRDKYYTRRETKWDRKGEETDIPITLETPCRLIFSEKRDRVTKKIIERHIDYEIGKPIEERFGLEQLGVSCGFSSHKFRLNATAKDAFYRKYPDTFRASDAFTLWHLTHMVYDLVRIHHNYLPLK